MGLPPLTEHRRLLAGVDALEAQRAALGDAVIDSSIAALRAKMDALPNAASPEQSLRQVTIVFLDFVGSTALAQKLDPEDIHAVMDGALARLTLTVRAHGGAVLQYAGDSMLAAFGTLGAREDDAESAVRCGLALLAQGQMLGAEVQAAHGHSGFGVRIGAHTGGVLLGGGVDAEGTIRGIAVNIAARMEQAAPAGALRISHDTYAHVRGLFDVQALEPVVVKGVDAPIHSFLVQRAKPRAFHIANRGIEGVATRMLGRDAELEVLQDTFKRLYQECKFACVTVVAEAGLGKSRLLTEFEAWAEARPDPFFIFRGRAHPHTQGQAYGLLRDMLARRLQIADDDTLDAAMAKLEQGVMPLFVNDDGEDLAQGHAHLLGHLVGIDHSQSRHVRGIRDDPRQIRNRAFHVAAQVFRRLGASKNWPVVLQLEDLHWADEGSLDFLDYLVQVNQDVRMLMLTMTRPGLFERRPNWGESAALHQRVNLEPLDRRVSRELAQALLQRLPEIPSSLSELVTRSSEGNPFYMEELVKMLIGEGVIDTGGSDSATWTLREDRFRATSVPPTLTGVLQARLDTLPPPERLALQEASVIGAMFWDRTLLALDASAEHVLPALVRRELVLRRPDRTFDDMREYAFRHQILHQVTYGTVLKRNRRELHQKVAQWLAGVTGLRAGDFLGAAAEHYEKAGDMGNAAEYHARAAEYAKQRFANDAVLVHTRSALALLDKAGVTGDGSAGTDASALDLRWRLLEVCEQALHLQGSRAAQHQCVAELSQLAETMGDEKRLAYVGWRRSQMSLAKGDWSACIDEGGSAMDLASGSNTPLRLKALHCVVIALAESGQHDASNALARQGLAEARADALKLNEAMLLYAMCFSPKLKDDRMVQLDLATQAQPIFRELGDVVGEADMLSTIGNAWLNLGQLELAERHLEEALRLARIVGNRQRECTVYLNQSVNARWRGDDVRALALARTGLALARAIEARASEVIALICLGYAEFSFERYSASERAYEDCYAKALALSHPVRHDAQAGLINIALARNELGHALQRLEKMLEQWAAEGALDGTQSRVGILGTCYETLAKVGDVRANGWLAAAYQALHVQALKVADTALRCGFLQNIPEHRLIVAAWTAAQGQE